MFGFYTETGHEDEVVDMEELDVRFAKIVDLYFRYFVFLKCFMTPIIPFPSVLQEGLVRSENSG